MSIMHDQADTNELHRAARRTLIWALCMITSLGVAMVALALAVVL